MRIGATTVPSVTNSEAGQKVGSLAVSVLLPTGKERRGLANEKQTAEEERRSVTGETAT